MARSRSADICREPRKVIRESLANELARETGAVQRERRVRIYEVIGVPVLGFAIGSKRTLAALRRRYERATGKTIEEGSFYKRFSPGLVMLLKKLLARTQVWLARHILLPPPGRRAGTERPVCETLDKVPVHSWPTRPTSRRATKRRAGLRSVRP